MRERLAIKRKPRVTLRHGERAMARNEMYFFVARDTADVEIRNTVHGAGEMIENVSGRRSGRFPYPGASYFSSTSNIRAFDENDVIMFVARITSD